MLFNKDVKNNSFDQIIIILAPAAITRAAGSDGHCFQNTYGASVQFGQRARCQRSPGHSGPGGAALGLRAVRHRPCHPVTPDGCNGRDRQHTQHKRARSR